VSQLIDADRMTRKEDIIRWVFYAVDVDVIWKIKLPTRCARRRLYNLAL
jgi:hypothetical protein